MVFVVYLNFKFCLQLSKKIQNSPDSLHFVTYLVPNFVKSNMDGPSGLHYVTHLVPNLDMLNPLDLLAVD
ncbi:hypothetical protein Hanom_Chr06g00481271 [Helianthus anomalus]